MQYCFAYITPSPKKVLKGQIIHLLEKTLSTTKGMKNILLLELDFVFIFY